MKSFVLLLLAAVGLVAQPAQAPAGERHEFVITDFHTENGATLPQARVVYTSGHWLDIDSLEDVVSAGSFR